MSSSSGGGNGGGNGCLVLAVIVFVLWVASNQPWAKSEPLDWSSWDSITRNFTEFFVQSNPFPVEQVHAVQKAFSAIETRSWSQYKSSFEPGTQLVPQEPGNPGRFVDMEYTLLTWNDIQAVVSVKGKWVESNLSGLTDRAIYVDEEITVVKAKKDMLADIDVGGGKVHSGVEFGGWFVQFDQKPFLPFNYSTQRVATIPPKVKGTFVFVRDNKIYLANADNTVVVDDANDLGQIRSPTWVSGGRYVIFSSTRDTNHDGVINFADENSIYVLEIASLKRTKLSGEDGTDYYYSDLSPDGTWIRLTGLRQRPDGFTQRDVYLVSVDGSRSTNLSGAFPYVDSMSWSPDSKHFSIVVSMADTNQDGTIDYEDLESIFVGNCPRPKSLTAIAPVWAE